MKVTEVKVTPHRGDNDRLLAYARITLDGELVLHDLRLIAGSNGHPFVAMPDRDAFTLCPRCESRVALRHRHCPQCGLGQSPGRVARDADGMPFLTADGRPRHHFDVVHPCDTPLRRAITAAVVAEYQRVMAGQVRQEVALGA